LNSTCNLSKTYQEIFHASLHPMYYGKLIYDDSKPVDIEIIDANPSFGDLYRLTIDQINHKKGSEVFQTNPLPYLNIYDHIIKTSQDQCIEVFHKEHYYHFPRPATLIFLPSISTLHPSNKISWNSKTRINFFKI